MVWKNVSKDEARAHPLYGFRGWMLSLWILYFLGWLVNFANLSGLNDAALISLYGTENMGMVKFSVAMSQLLALPLLVLAPLRHSMMPKMSIICLWLGAVLGFGITFSILPIWMALSGSAVGVILSALWTWYLLKSKRVNVTYNLRIPESYEPDHSSSSRNSTATANNESRYQELSKLAELRDKKLITDEEFEQQKQKLMA